MHPLNLSGISETVLVFVIFYNFVVSKYNFIFVITPGSFHELIPQIFVLEYKSAIKLKSVLTGQLFLKMIEYSGIFNKIRINRAT